MADCSRIDSLAYDPAVQCELATLLHHAYLRNIVTWVATVLAVGVLTFIAATVGRVLSIYLVSSFI